MRHKWCPIMMIMWMMRNTVTGRIFDYTSTTLHYLSLAWMDTTTQCRREYGKITKSEACQRVYCGLTVCIKVTTIGSCTVKTFLIWMGVDNAAITGRLKRKTCKWLGLVSSCKEFLMEVGPVPRRSIVPLPVLCAYYLCVCACVCVSCVFASVDLWNKWQFMA